MNCFNDFIYRSPKFDAFVKAELRCFLKYLTIVRLKWRICMLSMLLDGIFKALA